jgi:hypothetical protein
MGRNWGFVLTYPNYMRTHGRSYIRPSVRRCGEFLILSLTASLPRRCGIITTTATNRSLRKSLSKDSGPKALFKGVRAREVTVGLSIIEDVSADVDDFRPVAHNALNGMS